MLLRVSFKFHRENHHLASDESGALGFLGELVVTPDARGPCLVQIGEYFTPFEGASIGAKKISNLKLAQRVAYSMVGFMHKAVTQLKST